MLIWLLPFVAAIGDALSLIAAKSFLRRFGRLTASEFNWLAFIGIVSVASLILLVTRRWPEPGDISVFWPQLLLLIGLATASNILFFHGLEKERVSALEPFIIFTPLATILIVSAIYPAERHWAIYVGLLAATAILFWANLHRHRIALSTGILLVIGFWVTYGFESVVVKNLLTTFEPLTLYWMRCIGVLLSLTIVSPPKWTWLKVHHLPFAGLLGVLAVATVTALYTSFAAQGVAATLFVMVLSPVLVYWFSTAILHERWSFKNLLAGGAIVLLVVGVSLLTHFGL